jgi:hypothetical protein
MAESEQERIERIDREAAAADARIQKGEHWADWRYLAVGFGQGRRWAMHRSGSNRPEGKHYARFFSEWMASRPWALRHDKPTRAALLWYDENSAAVEAWLATLAQNQREKWVHPHTIRKHYEAAHRVPVGGTRTGLTPIQKRNEAIATLEEENTRLKRDMAKVDSGSLFDLVHDSAASIVTVIAGTISVSKMREIGNGLMDPGGTAMTTDARFLIELLETRLRFLNQAIADAGRFDPTFDVLTAERDAVVEELEGLHDDMSPRVPR